jgi:hypothetical protein
MEYVFTGVESTCDCVKNNGGSICNALPMALMVAVIGPVQLSRLLWLCIYYIFIYKYPI